MSYITAGVLRPHENRFQKYGGPGGDILLASVMWDEQSYSGCSGPGFSIHSGLFAVEYFGFIRNFLNLYRHLPALHPALRHRGAGIKANIYLSYNILTLFVLAL